MGNKYLFKVYFPVPALCLIPCSCPCSCVCSTAPCSYACSAGPHYLCLGRPSSKGSWSTAVSRGGGQEQLGGQGQHTGKTLGWSVMHFISFYWTALHSIGLIWVKEEGRTGVSKGWQGCSEEQPCQPEENPVLPDSFTQIFILFPTQFFKVLRSAGE